jgi:hypothetical protein
LTHPVLTRTPLCNSRAKDFYAPADGFYKHAHSPALFERRAVRCPVAAALMREDGSKFKS